MQDHVFSSKRALDEAEEENRNLRARLAEARRVSDFGADFEHSEGVYWKADYPYCPNCWEAGQIPMRLTGPVESWAVAEAQREWTCPIHKAMFALRFRAAHRQHT